MPHLIIESSSTLPSTVIEELHKEVGELETVSLSSVKTRYYSPTITLSGEMVENDHTAITLKLLSGRSQETKEKMSNQLYKKAKNLIEGSITVEIDELGIYLN